MLLFCFDVATAALHVTHACLFPRILSLVPDPCLRPERHVLGPGVTYLRAPASCPWLPSSSLHAGLSPYMHVYFATSPYLLLLCQAWVRNAGASLTTRRAGHL
eukprot:354548-Chlamydomonas_euryale.AAC.20